MSFFFLPICRKSGFVFAGLLFPPHMWGGAHSSFFLPSPQTRALWIGPLSFFETLKATLGLLWFSTLCAPVPNYCSSDYFFPVPSSSIFPFYVCSYPLGWVPIFFFFIFVSFIPILFFYCIRYQVWNPHLFKVVAPSFWGFLPAQLSPPQVLTLLLHPHRFLSHPSVTFCIYLQPLPPFPFKVCPTTSDSPHFLHVPIFFFPPRTQ